MMRELASCLLVTLLVKLLRICNATESVSELVSRLEPELWRRAEAVRHLAVPLADSQFHTLVKEMVRQRVPVHAESEECRAHSQLVVDAVMRGETWALCMFEAATKFPSRLLDGNIIDFGLYHECLGSREPDDLFLGQHCLVETRGITPPELFKTFNYAIDLSRVPEQYNVERYLLMKDLTLSVCVPSSCSARDVQVHMDRVLAPVNASALVHDSSCSTARPLPLRPMDYVAISVFLGILAIVVWSSLKDTFSSGPKSDMVEAFSLGRNWRRLTDTREGAGDVSCLHGVRVLATAGIILAHRLVLVLTRINTPVTTRYVIQNSYLVVVGEKLADAIEVFLVMGGTVRALGFLRDRSKGKELNIVADIGRRYMRFMPTLAALMLFTGTLLVHTAVGPMWHRSLDYYTSFCCGNFWFLTALPVHNYIAPFASCVPESWYLAADFQLFIVAPLILLPLYHRPKLGIALLSSACVLSLAVYAITCYVKETQAFPFTTAIRPRSECFTGYIVQSHLRASSYLLGLGLGYLIFTLGQNKKQIPKKVLSLGWVASLASCVWMAAVCKLAMSPDHKYTAWLDISYVVLNKFIVAANAAWVIFLCTQGYGGILNDILSWRGFRPWARLSLGMYLTHYSLIQIPFFSKQRHILDLNYGDVIHQWIGDVAMSTILAVPLYFCVEMPCNVLVARYLTTRVASDPTSSGTAKRPTSRRPCDSSRSGTGSLIQKVKTK